MFAATNICRDKGFVSRKICLSQQKFFFRNKPSFVATKVVFFVVFFVGWFGQILVATKDILVAAPANDR